MSAGFRLPLRFGDTTVELRTDREELRDALAHVYGAFLDNNCHVACPELSDVVDGSGWSGSLDGEEFCFAELYSALRMLENRIAKKLLSELGDALLLHSSAVTDTRNTIVIVGRSGVGKTTLALELVCRGMCYLTDEFTVIKANELHPFPRSAARKFDGPKPEGVNLEIPNSQLYYTYLLPEHRAKLESVSFDSIWLFLAKRVPGKPARLRKIGAAETTAQLMTSTFHLKGHVCERWPDLTDFVAKTRATVLEYDRAEDGVDALLDYIEASSAVKK